MEAHAVATFLLQISILLITAKVLGAICSRLGIGEITGELLAGLIWGPSFIASTFPSLHAAIFPANQAAQHKLLLTLATTLGVTILIFLSGMEIDLANEAPVIRGVVLVTGFGLIIPLIGGALLAHFVPTEYVPHGQFWGMTALLAIGVSVTTVPALARIIADNGVGRTRFGQVLLASAISTDTAGWLLLALALTLVVGDQGDAVGATKAIAKVVCIIITMFAVPRYISPLLETRLRRFWVNPERLFALSVAAFLIVCAVTQLIGLNVYLGAVIFALIVGRIPVVRDAMIRGMGGFASTVFMPLFFINIGLAANLTILGHTAAFEFGLALLVVAACVKIIPCYFGAKLAGLSEWESRTVALGMNARGGMEMVIAFAALAAGVWSLQLFTIVVLLALLTNMAAAPTINWGLRRMGEMPGAFTAVVDAETIQPGEAVTIT